MIDPPEAWLHRHKMATSSSLLVLTPSSLTCGALDLLLVLSPCVGADVSYFLSIFFRVHLHNYFLHPSELFCILSTVSEHLGLLCLLEEEGCVCPLHYKTSYQWQGSFVTWTPEVPTMLECGPLRFTCWELDSQCNTVERWGDLKIMEVLTSWTS